MEVIKAAEEVEEIISNRKRERQTITDLKRDIRLEPKFVLNLARNRFSEKVGVFEDKYYHFVNIGVEFPGLTHDHSLDNILFGEFLGKTFRVK